mmetsp:Transcript_11656/g.47104  ORF Transcript_11656/g.47104 Transcript_11656/m.47104 type:complete len:220 (+) Transcript_11656:319-978(+)
MVDREQRRGAALQREVPPRGDQAVHPDPQVPRFAPAVPGRGLGLSLEAVTGQTRVRAAHHLRGAGRPHAGSASPSRRQAVRAHQLRARGGDRLAHARLHLEVQRSGHGEGYDQHQVVRPRRPVPPRRPRARRKRAGGPKREDCNDSFRPPRRAAELRCLQRQEDWLRQAVCRAARQARGRAPDSGAAAQSGKHVPCEEEARQGEQRVTHRAAREPAPAV